MLTSLSMLTGNTQATVNVMGICQLQEFNKPRIKIIFAFELGQLNLS